MTAPLLVQIDGMWWPAADTHARPVITADCGPAIEQMLPHVPGRDCIVQAGANVGVYPLALADHFKSVITAEPDPVNWACLERNLRARDPLLRVEAHFAAFSDGPGWCDPVEVEAGNCGAHRVDFKPAMQQASTPVMTIDGLDLPACDVIWLDIEGAEWFALVGATRTIERFSPTIAVEDKGLHRAFGIADGALQTWLDERGYSQVQRIGRDKVYRRTT